jgi:hypothetical protein
MTPQGWWSIKCERCGKNDAEHGEFPFDIVFDEQTEGNILVCEDCRRSDDLPAVSEPSNPFGFRRMSRYASWVRKQSE